MVVSCAAYQDIVKADRIVTEPDDIVKIEDEMRRQEKDSKRLDALDPQSRGGAGEEPGSGAGAVAGAAEGSAQLNGLRETMRAQAVE